MTEANDPHATHSEPHIELRSEKVRHLIETVPVALVRWGTVIIAFILLALLAVLFFVPYPYGEEGETIFRHLFLW